MPGHGQAGVQAALGNGVALRLQTHDYVTYVTMSTAWRLVTASSNVADVAKAGPLAALGRDRGGHASGALAICIKIQRRASVPKTQ